MRGVARPSSRLGQRALLAGRRFALGTSAENEKARSRRHLTRERALYLSLLKNVFGQGIRRPTIETDNSLLSE
jgi:hypothetical protein